MVVGTGGSLTVAGAGTINATTLLASTWAAPAAIGSGTPAAGTFSTLALTTDLGVIHGGLGADMTALAIGAIPYANSTTTYSTIVAGAAGEVMTGNGAGVAPSFQVSGAGAWTSAAGETTPDTATDLVAIDGALVGITQSETLGLRLRNATPATVGVQKYSPMAVLEAQGWETAVGTSMTTEWALQARPVQGVAAPTSVLDFMSSIDAGAYGTMMTLTSAGTLTVTADLQIGPGKRLANNEVGFEPHGSIYLNSAQNMVLNARDSLIINVDSANGLAGEALIIAHNNTLALGTELFRFQDDGIAYWGGGVTADAPAATALHATGGTTGAASINASTLTIQGGLPSGAGTGGSVIVRTTDGVDPGGFGAQVPTTVATFDATATAASVFRGGVSSPIGASNGEAWGLSAISTTSGTALGYLANAGVDGVAIGQNTTSGQRTTILGKGANGTGSDSVRIGYNSGGSGVYSTCIGATSNCTVGVNAAYGYGATAVFNNQVVFGSTYVPATDWFVGEGISSASPIDVTFAITGGLGSNIGTGNADLIFQASLPTGSTVSGGGGIGSLLFNIGNGDNTTAPNTTQHTAITALKISNTIGAGAQTPTVTITADLAMTELSGAPTDITGAGQLWTESDNAVHFLDGDGNETHLVKHNDAKFYFNGVGTALDLTEANVDHGIDAATMDDVDGGWTFKAGTNGATGGFTITAVADDGSGDVRCTTSAAHGITAPSVVVVTNTDDVVDLPNGIYYVDNVSDTTHFDLLGVTFTATTVTADYVEPSQLTAGAGDLGEYVITWDLNQESSGGGSTYITKVWKCTSAGTCTNYDTGTRERTTATNTIGSYSGTVIESVTASGDKYFLTVQAGSTTVDPTNKYGSLMLVHN